MSSIKKNIYLEPGSIWFDFSPKKRLVFSPSTEKTKIITGEQKIFVKEFKEDFTPQDEFYFWASRAIHSELSAAKTLPIKLDRHLNAYHQQIKDPVKQFEFAEITASYIFRQAHPGLDNLSYGQRLFDCLFTKGCIPTHGSVLDIGAGLGIHTRHFLDRFKEKAKTITGKIRYVSADLSMELLSAQKERNKNKTTTHFFIQADALRLPFADKTFNLILANEIIADFPVTRCFKDRPDTFAPFVKKYGLCFDDAPREFLVNSAALYFLSQLQRVLKPKGVAVVIEYGEDWGYPTATKLKGHTEYSVHFGHMITAAKELGFCVEYDNLFHFLNFNPLVEIITGNSFSLLQRLMKQLHQEIDMFAYTPAILRERLPTLYPKIHNLQFEKLEKLAVCFKLQDFKVLILRK